MKTTDTVFIIVAVVIRLAALVVAMMGVFAVITPLLVGGLGSFILLRVVAIYFALGVLLWVASKPVAALVLRGLGDRVD